MRLFLERIHSKDCVILKLFNHSIKCSLLDILMPPITYLGSLTFMVIFCLSTLFMKNDYIHSYGLKCIIALAFGASLTQIIKKNVNRARPFLKIDNLYIKKIGIDNYSFPSGHTSAAFTLAIMTCYYFPFLSMTALILGMLVGISRMYLGVHYPTDVLIGMILGITSSVVVYNFVNL